MEGQTQSASKAIVLGSLALLLPASQVILLGWPRWWAPFPIVLVYPLFENWPWPAVVFAPAFCFLLTISFIAVYLKRPPLLSSVLASLLMLLHIWWLYTGWQYGITWQGAFHTIFVALISCVVSIVGILLLLVAWRRSSWWYSFWGHWCLGLQCRCPAQFKIAVA